MLKLIRTLALTGAVTVPLAIITTPALAGSVTTNFNVTATVVSSCVINSATDMVFGDYNVNALTALTNTSTIKVNCTKNAPYVIALSYGANGGGVGNRIMEDTGGDKLNYNLYTDPSWTNVWQDTTTCSTPGTIGANCGGGTGAGPGSTYEQSYTVYGQVPTAQNVPTGSYSDIIMVTVTF